METAINDIAEEDADETEVERAYLRQAGGDPSQALREAIRDALAERCEARTRKLVQDRLISEGYVRGRPFRQFPAS